MRCSIEYLPDTKFLDAVEVEDIGNVAIVAYNDMGIEYYILTYTELGFTKVHQFGPLIADMDNIELTRGFNYNYQELEYNENKLIKILEKFVQEPKKMITQVFEIDKQDIFDRLKHLKLSEEI